MQPPDSRVTDAHPAPGGIPPAPSPPTPTPPPPRPEGENVAHAIPSLATPFAIVGAAAGLFSILAIGSFRDAARDVSPFAPMLATAGVAAIAGETLRRWSRLHEPGLPREVTVIWVSVITAAAGAASGGAVGLATWGPSGLLRFALGGALSGLAFAPSSLVVFDAAKRAARARNGSLVAATDRRTMLSTVLAGVAFAGALPVPAILSANASRAIAPLAQVALSFAACVAAAGAIAALERRDRKDRAALLAHARDASWFEPVAEGDEAPAAASPTADLGLGSERWSRANDAAYRSSGRPEVVLKGSKEQAMAAFDECARRRHRSLVVAAAGLTAVSVAFALRLSVYR